jgi:uncharacterized protein (TIGR00251 family)
MEKYYITKLGNRTVLKVYVQPGASHSGLVGLYGDPPRIKIKVKAPPQDGEANLEIMQFLANFFEISKSKVEIIRGLTSRRKDLLIDLPVEKVGTRFSM